MRAQPDMCQTGRYRRDCRMKARSPRVFGQYGLMVLTSACNQRSYGRRAYALPDVTHEVHQAGRSIAFLLWKANVAGSREGNEQKSDRQVTHNANPHSGPKTYKQIKLLARDIHP